MLIIDQGIIQTFDELAVLQFREHLRRDLLEQYPAVLGGFPESVQAAIIDNCFGRASVYGLDWESSLSMFTELMFAVAPNFDEHEIIGDYLSAPSVDSNRHILAAVDRLPERVWAEAESGRSELPLYIAPTNRTSPLIERTAAALRLVLFDASMDDEGWLTLARLGSSLSHEFLLDSIDDAPLAWAACLALYSDEFPSKAHQHWIDDIFCDPNLAPHSRVDLLRTRVAIDFGRRV